jgi:hypothetical protein
LASTEAPVRGQLSRPPATDGTDVDGSGRGALTDQLERADKQREAAEQRADRAELRAQVAEDGREGERTRSDHLRDRIELLLVQVAELKAAAVRAEVSTMIYVADDDSSSVLSGC